MNINLVMEFLLHLVGFCNLAFILKASQKRKFFCVVDKVTVGSRMPQCLLGAFIHLACMLLVLLGYSGLCFYLISFWFFILFYAGIYTYKTWKELCGGCIIAYCLSFALSVLAFASMDYTPYIVVGIYVLVTMVSLCLTASTLDKTA